LFSPYHYVHDVCGREENSKHWLENIFQHLQHTISICDREEDKTLFDFESWLKELHTFVDTLHVNCEGSSMKYSWRIFCATKLYKKFLNMSKLWQTILTILASTVACERGFSRQNIIKDVQRKKLSVATLNSLMWVSLAGPDSSMVEWNMVYEIWKEAKQRRILNI
jgi:hypothetical protein